MDNTERAGSDSSFLDDKYQSLSQNITASGQIFDQSSLSRNPCVSFFGLDITPLDSEDEDYDRQDGRYIDEFTVISTLSSSSPSSSIENHDIKSALDLPNEHPDIVTWVEDDEEIESRIWNRDHATDTGSDFSTDSDLSVLGNLQEEMEDEMVFSDLHQENKRWEHTSEISTLISSPPSSSIGNHDPEAALDIPNEHPDIVTFVEDDEETGNRSWDRDHATNTVSNCPTDYDSSVMGNLQEEMVDEMMFSDLHQENIHWKHTSELSTLNSSMPSRSNGNHGTEAALDIPNEHHDIVTFVEDDEETERRSWNRDHATDTVSNCPTDSGSSVMGNLQEEMEDEMISDLHQENIRWEHLTSSSMRSNGKEIEEHCPITTDYVLSAMEDAEDIFNERNLHEEMEDGMMFSDLHQENIRWERLTSSSIRSNDKEIEEYCPITTDYVVPATEDIEDFFYESDTSSSHSWEERVAQPYIPQPPRTPPEIKLCEYSPSILSGSSPTHSFYGDELFPEHFPKSSSPSLGSVSDLDLPEDFQNPPEETASERTTSPRLVSEPLETTSEEGSLRSVQQVGSAYRQPSSSSKMNPQLHPNHQGSRVPLCSLISAHQTRLASTDRETSTTSDATLQELSTSQRESHVPLFSLTSDNEHPHTSTSSHPSRTVLHRKPRNERRSNNSTTIKHIYEKHRPSDKREVLNNRKRPSSKKPSVPKRVATASSISDTTPAVQSTRSQHTETLFKEQASAPQSSSTARNSSEKHLGIRKQKATYKFKSSKKTFITTQTIYQHSSGTTSSVIHEPSTSVSNSNVQGRQEYSSRYLYRHGSSLVTRQFLTTQESVTTRKSLNTRIRTSSESS